MPKTLDETIAELEALRNIHGGNVELTSSKGAVSFRAVETEGETFIVLEGFGAVL